MKYLVVLSLLSAALALPAAAPGAYDYHETLGVRRAASIRAAEQAVDFSGSRIVGGSPAPLGANPHLGGLVISLNNGWTSVCGSSLLSNTRAVTAAHCWWDGVNQANQFVVVLGATTLFFGGTRLTTSNVQMHASWNPLTAANDIAIITIPWVTYNNNIRNIALPTGALANNNFAGWTALAAGYGAQSDSAGIGTFQVQHQVDLPVITNAACAQTFGSSVIIASTICTSGAGGRSICGGDSGGPLSVVSGGQNVLIGVTSFGAQFCQQGFPQGFARVTAFLSWIQARI